LPCTPDSPFLKLARFGKSQVNAVKSSDWSVCRSLLRDRLSHRLRHPFFIRLPVCWETMATNWCVFSSCSVLPPAYHHSGGIAERACFWAAGCGWATRGPHLPFESLIWLRCRFLQKTFGAPMILPAAVVNLMGELVAPGGPSGCLARPFEPRQRQAIRIAHPAPGLSLIPPAGFSTQ
jgi:hypothetical protein